MTPGFSKDTCTHMTILFSLLANQLGGHQVKVTVHHTINRAAFVCLFVCLFVPLLLRGPLTDLRQTWWVYVGGPRNCPWGVLFWKGQRVNGSNVTFSEQTSPGWDHTAAKGTASLPSKRRTASKSLITSTGIITSSLRFDIYTIFNWPVTRLSENLWDWFRFSLIFIL